MVFPTSDQQPTEIFASGRTLKAADIASPVSADDTENLEDFLENLSISSCEIEPVDDSASIVNDESAGSLRSNGNDDETRARRNQKELAVRRGNTAENGIGLHVEHSYFWEPFDRADLVDAKHLLRNFKPVPQIYLAKIPPTFTAAKVADVLKNYADVRHVVLYRDERKVSLTAEVDLANWESYEKLLCLAPWFSPASHPKLRMRLVISYHALNSMTVFIAGYFTHKEEVFKCFKKFGCICHPPGISVKPRRNGPGSTALIPFCHPSALYKLATYVSKHGFMALNKHKVSMVLYEASQKNKRKTVAIQHCAEVKSEEWSAMSPPAAGVRTNASRSVSMCSSTSAGPQASGTAGLDRKQKPQPGVVYHSYATAAKVVSTGSNASNTENSPEQGTSAGQAFEFICRPCQKKLSNESEYKAHMDWHRKNQCTSSAVRNLFPIEASAVGAPVNKTPINYFLDEFDASLSPQTPRREEAVGRNPVIAGPSPSSSLSSSPSGSQCAILSLSLLQNAFDNKCAVLVHNVNAISSTELFHLYLCNERSGIGATRQVNFYKEMNLIVLEFYIEAVATSLVARNTLTLEGKSLIVSPSRPISARHFALTNLSPNATSESLRHLVGYFGTLLNQACLKQWTRLNAKRGRMCFGFENSIDFIKLMTDLNAPGKSIVLPLRDGVERMEVVGLAMPDSVLISGLPAGIQEDTLLYSIEALLESPRSVRCVTLNDKGQALVVLQEPSYVERVGTSLRLFDLGVFSVVPFIDFVDSFWS